MWLPGNLKKSSWIKVKKLTKEFIKHIECSDGSEKLSYEDVEAIAKFIQGKTEIQPEIGIICGSGLGQLAENLDSNKPKVVISYRDIPKFPNCHGNNGTLAIRCCPHQNLHTKG